MLNDGVWCSMTLADLGLSVIALVDLTHGCWAILIDVVCSFKCTSLN